MPVPLPFSPYFYIIILFAKWQWELRQNSHPGTSFDSRGSTD
jgi:hypothetical protein